MDFREEQRFGAGWLRFWAAVLLGPTVLVAVVLAASGVLTQTDPGPVLPIFGILLAAGGVGVVLIARLRVVVAVDAEAVRIGVRPFPETVIPASEIVGLEEVSSGLRRRFGSGVGWRASDRRARFALGGDAGVVIQRGDGWRFVVGSERPEELAAAIQRLVDSRNPF